MRRDALGDKVDTDGTGGETQITRESDVEEEREGMQSF